MRGKCVKQETIAIIENQGQYWIGSNWCHNAQEECPRKDYKSGEGYELCKSVCQQDNHAEVDVCMNAGVYAKGGTLYLLGHTYCCDHCKKTMDAFGIKEVIIGRIPESMSSKII